MEELKQDVREIKSQVLELVKQGATHNSLLREHERRSLALEAKLEPVEKHVNLVDKILKTLGAITTGAMIQFLIRYLT